jgi:hypothetical protein
MFTHFHFIENLSIWSWKTNASFLRWLYPHQANWSGSSHTPWNHHRKNIEFTSNYSTKLWKFRSQFHLIQCTATNSNLVQLQAAQISISQWLMLICPPATRHDPDTQKTFGILVSIWFWEKRFLCGIAPESCKTAIRFSLCQNLKLCNLITTMVMQNIQATRFHDHSQDCIIQKMLKSSSDSQSSTLQVCEKQLCIPSI